MKNKNVVFKRLLSAALLGAMCVAPLIGSISSAQADPPRHAPAWGWRENNKDRNRDRRDYRSFTGTVTNVESSSKFDMRFDGKTYNVYVSGQLPRRLNRNDRVSVYGYRYGNNDIRNARVTIVRNR
jgi:hypothetical protein